MPSKQAPPPSPPSLPPYGASMPPAYHSAFTPEEIALHAAIVERRGDKPTHIEIWRELSEQAVGIVVVADDKPGLLSCISAALVATRIDVVAADAYCRNRGDGSIEAVDFLWIRRVPNANGVLPPIRARDIVSVAKAIEEAAEGAPGPRSSDRMPSTPSVSALAVESGLAPDGAAATERTTTPAVARIRFDNDPKDGCTVLTVEAVDRPGLLLAVTQALFRAGLQIIGLRATTEQGAAVDRFHIAEVDGSSLKQERLLTLQTAILGAIDEGTLARERRSAS